MWELFTTPLIISIALHAYRDGFPQLRPGAELPEAHRRLFANFVDATLRRRSKKKPFSDGETIRWLTWLAGALRRNGPTEFQLERLDFDLLPSRGLRLLSRAALLFSSAALAVCMLAGVFVAAALIEREPIRNGWGEVLDLAVPVLLLGLAYGLIGAFATLTPSETLRLSTSGFTSRLKAAVKFGVAVGFGFGYPPLC